MSQPLNIQIDGLNSFLRDVKSTNANIEPLVRGALQNSATKIQRNVRLAAPHKTGALQRSVLTTVDYPSAKVTVEEKYGKYVEDGTRPHLIQPKNKKALFWKGALNPYKSVKHPGTKPNPFFSRGVNDSVTYVQEQFIKVSERLVASLAGHR